MTKKQKDHRLGGSKMNKKQKDARKKTQFGGADPKRINWQNVLKQVVMDNKGPMTVAEIISKVQTYAETNGKTVPTAANIRQKFRTVNGKWCCAWVGKMFKIKRSKVKRDCVVSLKGRPK